MKRSDQGFSLLELLLASALGLVVAGAALNSLFSEADLGRRLGRQVRERQAAAIAQQQWLAKVQNQRFETLDMLRAVQTLLPRDEAGAVPENPADRQELHVDRMDCQYFPDLAVWFAGLKQQWAETHAGEDAAADAPGAAPATAEGEQPPAGSPAASADPAAAEAAGGEQKPEVTGPTGPGWVVEIQGYHFHNEPRHKPLQGAQFLRDTLIKNLGGKREKVKVSAGPLAGQEVSVSELGIGFPVIVQSSPIRSVRIPLVNLSEGSSRPVAGPPQPGGELAEASEPQELLLRRYNFVVQFCWQPRPAGQPPPPPPAAVAQ